ncbi:MAG: hypothetical protein J6J23_00010 [Clostridia bacterium]|nr:hypothetical protein [Clostridia bacterium]
MEFGKFSDATSLFEGYLNLEKAYTKKCQEAKELRGKLENLSLAKAEKSELDERLSSGGERENSQNSGELSLNEEKSSCALNGEGIEVVGLDVQSQTLQRTTQEPVDNNQGNCNIYNTKSEEIGLDKNKKDDIENRENSCSERFKSPEWRKSVTKFFARCPEAKSLKKEIGQVLLSDKSLQNAENCLEIAFERVKSNRPASIMGNDKPSEQPARTQAQSGEVDSDKEITLSEYLRLVAERKVNAPKFLTDAVCGGTIGLSPQRKINSLAEAGEYLMKNYF